MGKNYLGELENIPETIKWAGRQDVSALRRTLSWELGSYNLIAIGSGGSLAAATFAALLHETANGRLARTATPLEAITFPPPRDTAALLVSARGANVDIRRVAESLPHLGYEAVSCISTRKESPLGRILLKYGATIHEFEVPSGRDGFLATNSLMATLVLLYRASPIHPSTEEIGATNLEAARPHIEGPESVLMNRTLVILANGWAVPAAIDFESRFSEAAIANVSVTDPRNFAHGRHHWLSLHSNDTGIISLETAASESEAARVLRLLPEKTRSMRVVSSRDGPEASIELVRAGMELAGKAAAFKGIDPGRPNVASFGRRLFHAGGRSLVRTLEPSPVTRKRRAILGRSRVTGEILGAAFKEFMRRIDQTVFSGLAMDFDGTMVATSRRNYGMAPGVKEQLNRLLHEGLLLGIASGRGKSVYQKLREDLDPQHWGKVVVGLYNGGNVFSLAENIPGMSEKMSCQMEAATLRTKNLEELLGFTTVVRPQQISLRPAVGSRLIDVFEVAREQLADIPGLTVVRSSHSVDVVPVGASKNRVVDELYARRPGQILCIGDQGQYGGNDFDLLNYGLSLSVDRVSSNLNTCWNLGPPGWSGPSLTEEYLQCLLKTSTGFVINFNNSSALANLLG